MNREEMIMAYSRGELEGDLRSELEEHMESCLQPRGIGG
jgi:anti-sigma factor RsiW